MTEHCKDCCCARSWKALGITEFTGKSIPEHIEELQAENARLKIEKYMLIVPSYMRGMLERGEISQKDLDKWYKQALKGNPNDR